MPSNDTKIKKAYQQIEELLNEARKKIREAQEIADENSLIFSFDVAYGMGGSYEGKGVEYEDGQYDIKGNFKIKIKTRKHGEWIPSSHTC